MSSDDDNDDWWRHRNSCRVASQLLSGTVLPLLVVNHVQGEYRSEIFSGFLISRWNRLCWMTAGHVIEGLRQKVATRKLRIVSAKWLDNFKTVAGEAASVPADLRGLLNRSSSFLNRGIDFGVTTLGLNEASLLLANPRIAYLTDRNWRPVDPQAISGYYLVGYPESSVSEEKRATQTHIRGRVEAILSALPLQPVRYPGPDEYDEFWSDPEGFYGAVVPYADEPGDQPESVNGMSGGPIFSVSLDGNNVVPSLVAIQRSEKAAKRLVRGEPWGKVLKIIDAVMEQMN